MTVALALEHVVLDELFEAVKLVLAHLSQLVVYSARLSPGKESARM